MGFFGDLGHGFESAGKGLFGGVKDVFGGAKDVFGSIFGGFKDTAQLFAQMMQFLPIIVIGGGALYLINMVRSKK